jgi:hypothetical protein
MNNNILSLISFITGILLKTGDDMLDIYKFNHGNIYAEFLKVLITMFFTILIIKSDNLWVYLSVLGIWGCWVSAPHQYIEDSYARIMSIIFTIFPIIYIFNKFDFIKLKFLNTLYSLAIGLFLFIIIGFPFYIQDSLFFYHIFDIFDIFDIKNKEWVYEEVGINKLILRSLGILLSIIILYFVNNYKITKYLTETNYKQGFNCFSLMIIGYYIVSVINQIYNLYFNKNYNINDENKNKLKHKRDIIKYKNIVYDFFNL